MGFGDFLENRAGFLPFPPKCAILQMALPVTVGGPSPSNGGLVPRKGGIAMVTYSELFAYSLVIISVVSLVLQFCKRK